MMDQSIQEYLETLSGQKLRLKINDNRSTMLSVKWEPDCTKVSLHKMFLQAPSNVMEQLACYISRDKDKVPKAVRSYIEENLKKLDYSHTLSKHSLRSQGKVYNLQEHYDALNDEYFKGKLSLLITWFGKMLTRSSPRSRLTLGLFHDQLKLIKINRFLDADSVPEFMLDYVIYHEMLHYVCPSYIDEKGIHRIHSKEFKAREAEFQFFKEAQDWISQNNTMLFA